MRNHYDVGEGMQCQAVRFFIILIDFNKFDSCQFQTLYTLLSALCMEDVTNLMYIHTLIQHIFVIHSIYALNNLYQMKYKEK